MQPPRLAHKLALWTVLLTSLILKGYLAWFAEDLKLFGDPAMYIRMAKTWARGGGFTVDEANLWPPGMITFLGMHFRHFGVNLFYPRLTQCLLSTLTVWFIYRIALIALGRRWMALGAAAGVAFYPTLVAFTHYLWAETLYLFFFAGSVAAYFEGVVRDRRRWFVVAGVAFALAALTKSIGLYTAPLWLLWHLWQARGPQLRRQLGHAAVFVAVVAGCILPWTYRNYQEFDRFVLIDMSLGRNLYYGHNPLGPPNWDYGLGRPFGRHRKPNRVRCDEIPGMTHPKDVEKCEIEGAIQFIRENKVETLRRFGVKMADLFAPTSPLVYGIAEGKYQPPPEGDARLRWMALAILPWLLVGIGAVMSLTLVPWDRWKVWMGLLIFYYLMVHWATVGASRYRVTLEPFLIILAAQGLSLGAVALWRSRGVSRRALGFYALMAVVIYMWSTRAKGGLSEVIAYLTGS